MIKLTSVLLFVVMFSIVPLTAQRLPELPKPQIAQQDLRRAISRETQKIKAQSAAIDAKQMQKLLRQNSKNNWSAKKTALIILLAVGVAALVFVVIKYGKNCLRYRDDCNPAFDENCVCEEYERRIPAGQ